MKNVKKLLAGVAVMAVLVSFGGAGVVEAKASCPPHGPYVERTMEISQWYQPHYLTVLIPLYDQYGRFIGYLHDSTGKLATVECIQTQDRYHIGIYCDGCNWFLNDYFYEGPIMHTYCSVG